MPLKAWHSPANLILSTAANINGYFWGDGGGKGTATEFTPRVVYDLMDCQITLTLSSYIYTGKQLRPTVQSVRYSSASDRDSKNIFASAITKTLPSSGYSISGYGENIHCPSGTVTVLGAQNGSRTTVQTNEAVIGSAEVTFTINKATLTAPITMDPSKPYLNQSATASLSTYTSATAGTGQLAAVWRGSTKKAEGPKVTWSVQNRAGTVTEANGLQAKVSLTNTTATVTATLSDMNDFNDYTATLSVNTQPLKSWTPTLSANTPHPRVPISVKLLSGITDPTYQWYANDTAISGATAQSYTPTAADIGKTLSVKVTPNAASGYLDTSASAGIGSGSNSATAKVYAKDKAAFAGGEVCYLVNGKTSTGDKALWKQDIDNGNTPYDSYPVFDAEAVYLHSDGVYSNDPEKVSVTIAWGDMTFAYNAGSWDPEKHAYSGGWSPQTATGNDLSVQNNSNVALLATVTFKADGAFTQYGLTGTFNGIAADADRIERDGVLTTKLNLKSQSPDELKDGGTKKIGEITISLTTVGGGN